MEAPRFLKSVRRLERSNAVERFERLVRASVVGERSDCALDGLNVFFVYGIRGRGIE